MEAAAGGFQVEQKAAKQKLVMKEDSMEDDHDLFDTCEDDKKEGWSAAAAASNKGPNGGGGGGSSLQCCQAEKCASDLTDAKQYHRRHKVCQHHAKAQVVMVAGIRLRFCQQCSRFHELSEFDEAKRSCRRRLAGHNERRRKSSGDSRAGGPSSRKGTGTQFKELACRRVDDRSVRI